AGFRLASQAKHIGIVPASRLEDLQTKEVAIASEIHRLNTTYVEGSSLAQWLKRPEMHYATIPGHREDLSPDVIEQVEFSLKYQGYIDREQLHIERAEQISRQRIPDEFDYHAIGALRYESRDKLTAIRPRDLAQASRVSGVTPADITILSVWLKKCAREQKK
ncbi:MAG: tRNA uridine-5-carboxymethylaminomethyl(34) synthesis enzyme MnmG, partial [Holophagae bacterium]|nr:tRNA uridine-5-carboxymethylaminomethyl(34) synthesis enzyme MnmG [Holophagae bacterium]